MYIHSQPPSAQCRVCRVTPLRTDSIHCQESAGTVSVVPEVVPVTSATAFSGVIMDQKRTKK